MGTTDPQGTPDQGEKPDRSYDISPFVWEIISAIALLLAGLHALVPGIRIDAISLGLSAFALLILVFEIESVEWLGIRARRRELEQTSNNVQATSIPGGTVHPSLPPPPTPDVRRGSENTPAAERSVAIGTLRRPQLGSAELASASSDGPGRLLFWEEEIRRELLLIAGNAGRLPGTKDWNAYETAELAPAVRSTGLLPPQIESAIADVVRARRDALNFQINPRLLEPAERVAREVLTKLQQIKRVYLRVQRSDVELFCDEALSTPHPFRGIEIEHIDEHGISINTQVFPREHAYRDRAYVSWEWSNKRGMEAWYRTLPTGAAMKAFADSPVFVGREYPGEWHVGARVLGEAVSG